MQQRCVGESSSASRAAALRSRRGSAAGGRPLPPHNCRMPGAPRRIAPPAWHPAAHLLAAASRPRGVAILRPQPRPLPASASCAPAAPPAASGIAAQVSGGAALRLGAPWTGRRHRRARRRRRRRPPTWRPSQGVTLAWRMQRRKRRTATKGRCFESCSWPLRPAWASKAAMTAARTPSPLAAAAAGAASGAAAAESRRPGAPRRTPALSCPLPAGCCAAALRTRWATPPGACTGSLMQRACCMLHAALPSPRRLPMLMPAPPPAPPIHPCPCTQRGPARHDGGRSGRPGVGRHRPGGRHAGKRWPAGERRHASVSSL